MNILHLINGYSPVFGCGVADRCQKMSKYLSLLGHKVTVCSGDREWDEAYVKNSGDARILKFKSYLGRFAYTPHLKNYLNTLSDPFDIVHLMNHWTYQNVVGYTYAKKNHIPFVFSSMGALPIVGRSQAIKKVYQFMYGEHILKEASACIAITQCEVETYKTLGVSSEKIHFLPNGIDTSEVEKKIERENFAKAYGISPGDKIILYLGRLAHIKGTDILVSAFLNHARQEDPYKLVIVGPDYGLESILKARIAKHPLQNKIIFTGPLSGTKKLEAYQSADVFVVPSRQENMSIVAVEAAVCGVPVVITDVCDFNEIASWKAGRVVRADPNAIWVAIREILNMSPDEYESTRHNARHMVQELYVWEKLCKNLERILQDVMKGFRV